MRFGSILCLAVTISACGVPTPAPPPQTGSRQARERPRANSYPTSHADPIRAELARLNRWCSGQDDCDVVERPKAYPRRAAHGETRGFINSSKARLHKLVQE